jgi:hypothetical protein
MIHNAKIPFYEFVDCYKNSLGLEGAEELLKSVISRVNLVYRLEYNKEEALKICQGLKEQGGFIGIIGGIMASRILVR